MSSDATIKRWIKAFKSGNKAAAQHLWERFNTQLVRLARRRLQVRFRKMIDPEDIALAAFASLCRGAEEQRFPKLVDSHDLWRLLFRITMCQVLHVVRNENRQKRRGNFRETEENVPAAAIEQVVGREPSPEIAAEFADEYDRFMSLLRDSELVQVATWKFEGFTNAEIAEKLRRSLRTVERKLNLIRSVWLTEISQQE